MKMKIKGVPVAPVNKPKGDAIFKNENGELVKRVQNARLKIK